MKKSSIILMLCLCIGLIACQKTTKKKSTLKFEFKSTFFGGSSVELGGGIAIDDQANIFVAGITYSSDSSFLIQPFDNTHNGNGDILIAKFDSTLSHLLAATYIGGSGTEYAHSIDLDEDGNVYVLASTNSTDFPVTANCFDNTFNEGEKDAVIVKFDNSLTELKSATYFGGSGSDLNTGQATIKCISNNQIVIAGSTTSSNLIENYSTKSQNGYSGKQDIFIAKLINSLSELVALNYLGSSKEDGFLSLDIDNNDDIYLSGHCGGADFPISKHVIDSSFNKGDYNIFITKLANKNLDIEVSTFWGDIGNAFAYALCVDDDDNIIIGGHASGITITPNAFDNTDDANPDDAFIAKFNSKLDHLIASTYMGGTSGGNEANPGEKTIIEIDTDSEGNVYGLSYSFELMPTTPLAFDQVYNNSRDIYLTVFDPKLTQLKYGSYMGANSEEFPEGIVVHKKNVYLTGSTNSRQFPVSKDAFDKTLAAADIFVSKLSLEEVNMSELSFFSLAKLGFVKEIKNALKSNKSILNHKDVDGRTLLHWAAAYGHLNLVKFLTEKNAKINEFDNQGHTPFHLSIMHNQKAVFEYLLEDDECNIESKDKSGKNALHLASLYSYNCFIEPLLSHGLAHFELDSLGNRSIHYAARNHNIHIVNTLKEFDPKLIYKNHEGNTILHESVKSWKNQKVILAIANEYNIEIRNTDARTALLTAINTWNIENAVTLIELGANINAQDYEGKTVLHYAAINGDWFYEVAKRLIEKGINIGIIDKSGKTAKDYATEKKSTQILNLLKTNPNEQILRR